jgi:hypothetical protein
VIEFQEEIQGENLLIRCDNATVVAYINKQGGTKSIPLCLLLWDMMQWCLKHNIHIHAAHIPGTPLECICPQNFVVWISLQGYPSENIPLLLQPH